ncbi:MAG: hypothetical protein ACI85Q_000733 [Salibacteraceae bacterium]|jgi:hypothetical protein
MSANLVFKNGFFQTKSRSFDSEVLRKSLLKFVAQNKTYKSMFLQDKFA